MTTTKIIKTLKIKFKHLRSLPIINHTKVEKDGRLHFSCEIDERLVDIINHLKLRSNRNIANVSKKLITIYSNNIFPINIIETEKNHIFIDLNIQNEIFVNNLLIKSNKVKSALKDKEFEKTTRKIEVEL